MVGKDVASHYLTASSGDHLIHLCQLVGHSVEIGARAVLAIRCPQSTKANNFVSHVQTYITLFLI